MKNGNKAKEGLRLRPKAKAYGQSILLRSAIDPFNG